MHTHVHGGLGIRKLGLSPVSTIILSVVLNWREEDLNFPNLSVKNPNYMISKSLCCSSNSLLDLVVLCLQTWICIYNPSGKN